MAEIMNLDAESIKITRTDQVGMWQGFEFGIPSKFSTYFDDFMQYVAGDWTVTETDAAATEALAAAAPCANGVLLITNANADNNLVSLQRVGHAFVPTAGKNIYFEIRFQSNEATQVDLLAGLVITDTDPVTSITDGIVFRKDDGDTNIDFATTLGSATSTETAIGTLAADTYVKLGFKVTGISLVEYYVNDVKQGELSTNIPSAIPLRVTFSTQDGDTAAAVGAETASIDYVFVAQTR